MPFRDLARAFPLFLAAAALACQGSVLPVEPTQGTLEITITTTGAELDPNGYTVQVDAEPVQAIRAAEVVRTDALAGVHTVELEGLAGNCEVEGDNPRNVTVQAGDTLVVVFTVICSSSVGAVEVGATTTGRFTDSRGYLVTIDGTVRRPLRLGARENFAGIPAGHHRVGLSGAPENCVIAPDLEVEITAGATARVDIVVDCSATPRIAFTSNRDGIQLTLFVANPDGSSLTPLVEGGYAPTWSPDGRKIAFASDGDLYVVNADGTGRLKLFDDHDAAHNVGTIRWSPDNRTIGFDVQFSACDEECFRGQLWRINPDGTGLQRLADGFWPSWSPDGRTIAFTDALFQHVYVMGADGSGLAQITALPDPVSSAPGWSPDGSRIAFAAGGKIYLVSPDGTALVELAPFGRTSTMPSWSPDGRRIAFISSSQGPLQFGYSLTVMDADGSAASVLFANDDLVLDPTWSPDGGHIAFTANDRATGIFDVYSVKADGTGLVDVSGGRSYDAGPSWGRR